MEAKYRTFLRRTSDFFHQRERTNNGHFLCTTQTENLRPFNQDLPPYRHYINDSYGRGRTELPLDRE